LATTPDVIAAAPAASSLENLVQHLQQRPTLAAALLHDWFATHQSLEEREHVLAAVKNESERLLVIDSAAAEHLADALAAGADAANNQRFRALAAMARGDVRRVQGRYAEAVSLYDAGGRACEAIGDTIGWARSRIGWVLASQYCGRGREALPVAARAYQVLADTGEHLRAGGLSNNVAAVYYQLGDYAQALAGFERAIEHFEQARSSVGSVADERIAKALANKALPLTLLGRFAESDELCQKAREIFVRQGEHVSALRVDHFRASIYAGQGQYTKALRVQADALAAFEQAGLDDSAFQVALDMVTCQAALNHHAEALELAEDLARRCQRAGAHTEAAKARFRCAQALASLGDIHAALPLLDVVADEFASTGLTAELGAVALLRARVNVDAQDWPNAEALAEQAHALFAQRGLVERRTEAELVRAHAALGVGAFDRAEALAKSALDVSKSLDALPLSQAAHYVLAHVATAQRRPDRALHEYNAAICDLERIQSSLATELRTEFLGDKLQLFHDAIDLCIDSGELERGFSYLERAKSRALVDYLMSQPDMRVSAGTPQERELIDELRQLREQHAWFYDRLHHQPVASETERRTLQQAVVDRERRIVKVHESLALIRGAERLEALGPRASGEQPRPPQLEDDTALVEYVFWEDRGAAFIVSSEGIRVEALAVGSRALQRALNHWQLNLESTARALQNGESVQRLASNAAGQLTNLYRLLLEPLAPYLEHIQRLIVVPYGPAHGVPFHALFDGRNYVAERFEVWTAPSSSLLGLCSQRVRPTAVSSGALIVGHSGGRLPAVVEEARDIAALVGGNCYVEAHATRDVVLEQAAEYGILHLAAHGEARLDNPTFAHIALADGQLTMADVFTLRLDGALVTLSACETGRAAVVGGDEVVGLSRGFLFAGASTLVQSLWRVDDRATAHLMRCFYERLHADEAPGAALRAAQRTFIEQGTHPYVWAPFQIVGYGGPRRTIRKRH
jgi:CHAT domain-containing protein